MNNSEIAINVPRGAKYVNTAYLAHKSASIWIVEVDMRLKYAEVTMLCSGTMNGKERLSACALWFEKTRHSIFRGRSVKGEAGGEIVFVGVPLNYELYTAHNIGRYTIAAVFVRERRNKCKD